MGFKVLKSYKLLLKFYFQVLDQERMLSFDYFL